MVYRILSIHGFSEFRRSMNEFYQMAVYLSTIQDTSIFLAKWMTIF